MKKLIAFFEIPATDFRRAVDFYETVLGVQLPTFECETEKMACFTEEGETVGAISYTQSFVPWADCRYRCDGRCRTVGFSETGHGYF